MAAFAFGDFQCSLQATGQAGVGLYAWQQAFCQLLKRFSNTPHSGCAMRIDVVEYADDALAMDGARREGVNVQAGIILAPGAFALPLADLMHAQTVDRLQQFALVFGQQSFYQVFGVLMVALQQSTDDRFVGSFGYAVDVVFVDIEADVFTLRVYQLWSQ